jgi:hypothetical protein
MQRALIVDAGAGYGDPTSSLNSLLNEGWEVAKMERFDTAAQSTYKDSKILVIIEKVK